MACPDDLGDPLYKIFFNPECIAQLNKPHQRCPSTEVAFFMDFISSGLRFESISLTALGVFVLVGLLQLGGIPDPRGVCSSFVDLSLFTNIIVRLNRQGASLE